MLWVSTSSVALLQLTKVTSSVPRVAPPPSEQEARDGSAAALRPKGLRARFGQRKGNLCHFSILEWGGKGPHRQAQELKWKNKTKEKWV